MTNDFSVDAVCERILEDIKAEELFRVIDSVRGDAQITGIEEIDSECGAISLEGQEVREMYEVFEVALRKAIEEAYGTHPTTIDVGHEILRDECSALFDFIDSHFHKGEKLSYLYTHSKFLVTFVEHLNSVFELLRGIPKGLVITKGKPLSNDFQENPNALFLNYTFNSTTLSHPITYNTGEFSNNSLYGAVKAVREAYLSIQTILSAELQLS